MKVIFLDFDGVVIVPPFFREPDPEKIKLLNLLVKMTDSVVVVSSTWRLGRTVDRLQQILCDAGFKGLVLDKTPDLSPSPESKHFPSRERGLEIMAWLTTHPGVESYVVFDDDHDMGPIPKFRWVLTNFSLGLTQRMIGEAAGILRKPISKGSARFKDPEKKK